MPRSAPPPPRRARTSRAHRASPIAHRARTSSVGLAPYTPDDDDVTPRTHPRVYARASASATGSESPPARPANLLSRSSSRRSIDRGRTVGRTVGVSLTDVSPDSSYMNGCSTDVSVFDSLEIRYIMYWSMYKKLLRSEIEPRPRKRTFHDHDVPSRPMSRGRVGRSDIRSVGHSETRGWMDGWMDGWPRRMDA